ncbi:MAG: nucleoside hydrolase [Bacteroidales bacterium]|jgi:pyrimidine-specific ribonucleoside hydrolase|nr:nucleoside hydrolase [Bacteroidales bacterium]
MIKQILYLLVFFLSFSIQDVNAHKFAKYNIVIDTDCGIDDFRAMTYFMASRDYNINAVTTVDGILDPDMASAYIHEILKIYHHEGIPLGKGNKNNASKKYTEHARAYWKNFIPEIIVPQLMSSVELLYKAIENERKRTIVVAMGPLTNIAELIGKHPEIMPKIEIILWYSEFDEKPFGYNYEQNTKAYEIIRENNVPLKIISGQDMKLTDDFFESCKEIKSVYAKTVLKFFEKNKDKTYYMWDDFLALYLSYPVMFREKHIEEYLVKIDPVPESFYDILITGILNSEKPDEGVVFNEIPTSGFMLRKDVNEFAQQIIEYHGYVEFKIASLTSEIHSHMGIYSILGAKMGLRIMEYLHAGLDEINIISYAGYDPPVSCFNDGLQVGTGSTIGYGTIKVDTTQGIRPETVVIYNNREILFRIKQDVIEEIKQDVGTLIKAHGLESDMYWSKLREISIEKYWLGMSRFDIFEIEEIKGY